MINIKNILLGTEYQGEYSNTEIDQLEFNIAYLNNAGLDIYDMKLKNNPIFNSEEDHIAAILDHIRDGGRIDIKRGI